MSSLIKVKSVCPVCGKIKIKILSNGIGLCLECKSEWRVRISSTVSWANSLLEKTIEDDYYEKDITPWRRA